jgi:hypothetical protein
MAAESPCEEANASGLQLSAAMWITLRHLLRAYDMAQDLKRPRWEFALEMRALERAGTDHSDLRALICRGLIEHRLETSAPRVRRRTFRSIANLRFTRTSCFALSDWGLAISTHATNNNGLAANALLPVWDSHCRELRLGRVVLKRFRQPAKNQEAILAAFQEEGWPARIDSPIPGAFGHDSTAQLHDAVKRLNQQHPRFIRFECDGSGEGVMWRMRKRAP